MKKISSSLFSYIGIVLFLGIGLTQCLEVTKGGSIKSCGNRKKVKIAYPCFDKKT